MNNDNDQTTKKPYPKNAEAERMAELDTVLKEMAAMLKRIGLSQTEEFMARRANPQDPLCGFGIMGTVSYEVRQEDTDYTYGAQNSFLHSTALGLDFREKGSERRWAGDMEFSHERPDCLANINPGWLMHELYKTADNGAPAVSLSDCLRIDTLVVTVETKQKYVYDLRSKQWLKDSPEEEDRYGWGAP